MNATRLDEGGLRYTIALLLAFCLILGLRVRTTLATTGTAAPPAADPPAAASAVTVDGDRLTTQRTMLAEQARTRRDPFRRSEASILEQPELPVDGPPEVRKLVGPALSALLYDHRDPMTQISVDGERSGWLRPGDTFRGWRVAAITPRAVTITKGGKQVILP